MRGVEILRTTCPECGWIQESVTHIGGMAVRPPTRCGILLRPDWTPCPGQVVTEVVTATADRFGPT